MKQPVTPSTDKISSALETACTVSIMTIIARCSFAQVSKSPSMYWDNRLPPKLRRPLFWYFMFATTDPASSAVLIMGTTSPIAPASRVRWIQTVSFQGTRAMGTTPPSCIALKQLTMVAKSTGLC